MKRAKLCFMTAYCPTPPSPTFAVLSQGRLPLVHVSKISHVNRRQPPPFPRCAGVHLPLKGEGYSACNSLQGLCARFQRTLLRRIGEQKLRDPAAARQRAVLEPVFHASAGKNSSQKVPFLCFFLWASKERKDLTLF